MRVRVVPPHSRAEAMSTVQLAAVAEGPERAEGSLTMNPLDLPLILPMQHSKKTGNVRTFVVTTYADSNSFLSASRKSGARIGPGFPGTLLATVGGEVTSDISSGPCCKNHSNKSARACSAAHSSSSVRISLRLLAAVSKRFNMADSSPVSELSSRYESGKSSHRDSGTCEPFLQGRASVVQF